MNRFLHTILILLWGLWFGGIVMLFLAVQSLFDTFPTDHSVAGEAAEAIFHEFNILRLILAALALICSFFWWMSDRSAIKILIFFLLGIAVVAAVVISADLAPQIEHLRVMKMTNSSRFRYLHGLSMGVYMLETVFVFLAGLLLPGSSAKTGKGGGEQS